MAGKWHSLLQNSRSLARKHGSVKLRFEIFKKTYSANQSTKWFAYWRIFMACAELWKTDNEEWMVSHYLFERHQMKPKLNTPGY